MDHAEAVDTMAAQRYVLEEMTPEDRDAFEDHFFGCAACAADVRDGATIAAAMRREKASIALVPQRASHAGWLAAAASLVIAAFLGYQTMTLRGHLRDEREARVLPYSMINGESRGSETVITNASRPFALFVDIPRREHVTRYVVTIADEKGRASVTQPVTLDEASEPSVLLRIPGGLLTPGRYSVIVRAEPAGAPGSVGSFEVR